MGLNRFSFFKGNIFLVINSKSFLINIEDSFGSLKGFLGGSSSESVGSFKGFSLCLGDFFGFFPYLGDFLGDFLGVCLGDFLK